jgi:mannose/fructose/N-acetylgalactosamine-specific phosphotransferase system component IID
MQALGFTFALLPWAPRDPERGRAFIRRHLSYINTSPPLSGLILGTVAATEEALAAEAQRSAAARAHAGDDAFALGDNLGSGDPTLGPEEARLRTDTWKRRLEGPLAALGDRIFWGWLRPLLGVAGVWILLGGLGGHLPSAMGGRGAPSASRALWAIAGALLFYNVPHLVTRLRAASAGLAAGRGTDPDSAIRALGRGLGLTRLGALLEWVGPIALGALLGRWIVTFGPAAAGSGPTFAPLALLAAGILLGVGAGRFRVPPERVGMGVLAFLALVTA